MPGGRPGNSGQISQQMARLVEKLTRLRDSLGRQMQLGPAVSARAPVVIPGGDPSSCGGLCLGGTVAWDNQQLKSRQPTPSLQTAVGTVQQAQPPGGPVFQCLKTILNDDRQLNSVMASHFIQSFDRSGSRDVSSIVKLELGYERMAEGGGARHSKICSNLPNFFKKSCPDGAGVRSGPSKRKAVDAPTLFGLHCQAKLVAFSGSSQPKQLQGCCKISRFETTSEEEMVEELYGVIHARRIFVRKGGDKVRTNTSVLTFDSTSPPTSLKQLKSRQLTPSLQTAVGTVQQAQPPGGPVF
ncbi:hypothetical protein EGW08_023373 [Elysia chlorotica]|uniref:Uncharacterized protein n=1 Tax=Elysia chlorotica TaxID=188477 RepID=A0A3S1B0H4_ELYCH|nr:hypothetical protein EGW08_023373 [Elysia chlorotica]